MRTFGIFLIALFVSIGSNVWGDIKGKQEIGAEAKSKAPHISAQQLADDMSGGKEFVLLDMPTEAECDAGHIKDAQWLLRGTIEHKIQELVKNLGSRIVLCCGTGGRSALAVLTVKDTGFTNTVNLDGGFEA